MSYLNQKTVKAPISFSGVGLHTGVFSNLTIKPANPNSGILFIRTDLKDNNIVVPNFAFVSNTS